MARRKLTLREQLKGVQAAIRSRRTPPQLRDGLKRRAAELEKQLQAEGGSTGGSKHSGGIRDILGFDL